MKFPDEYFPLKIFSKQDFNNKVNNGREIASNLNILFCCTCKDVAKVIKYSISLCDYVGSYFKDYKIFLYENNSSDGTPDVIRSLNNDKIILKSEFIEGASYERSSSTLLNRCNLISNARNKYVDYINENLNYDYIFVFDADIEGGWSIDGIFNSLYYLEGNEDYGCMTSYCVVGGYENKPLEEIPRSNWLMFDSFAFRSFKLNDWSFPDNIAMNNFIKTERGAEPIPVNSNFNGLSIYKPKCFIDNKYSVKNYGIDSKTDSEHVAFNRGIWKKGLKVMLNPSMITSVSRHKYCKDN